MFFGSFWHAFGYMNSTSNLENVLKQENLTTETILDQENVVNEVKQLQGKFTNFLKSNSHIAHQIIEYSITMPNPEDTDEKKLYKYPFVSSEIFGAQIKGFEDIFFEDNQDGKNQEDESESDVEDEDEQNDSANKEEQAAAPEDTTEKQATAEVTEEITKTPESTETTEGLKTVDAEKTVETEETVEAAEKVEADGIKVKADGIKVKADDIVEAKDTVETENTAVPVAASAPSETEKAPENSEEVEEDIEQKDTSPTNKSASPQPSSQKKTKISKPKEKKYTGKELLNRLMQFIDTTEPLNDTLAGYFFKIINNVLTPNKQFFEFIATKPEILDQLVSHIRTKSISEIVLKLITVVGSDEETESVISQRKRLLSLLGEKFSTGDTFERENISYIFYEIISSFIQGESQFKKCSLFVQAQVLDDLLLANFFKVIVSTESESSCVAYGASILSILVTYYNSRIRQKRNSTQPSEEDEICNVNTDDDKIAFPAEKLFVTYLPLFIEFVGSTPNGEAHTTSYGAEIIPFGIGKLKLVDLFGHIFKSENAELITLMAKSNIFAMLLNLMIIFPWNNLLHIQIEKIILEGISMAISGTYDAVQQALFGREFNLLDFVATNSQQETAKPGKISKDIRVGYIGFLTNFAKKLNDTSSCVWLNDLKEGEAWKDYTDNTLKTILSNESQNLGGDNPKNKKEDDIEDINKFEIDIQRIYEKFNNYFRTNKTTKDDSNDDTKEEVQDGEDIPEDDNLNDRKQEGSSDEEDHDHYHHDHDDNDLDQVHDSTEDDHEEHHDAEISEEINILESSVEKPKEEVPVPVVATAAPVAPVTVKSTEPTVTSVKAPAVVVAPGVTVKSKEPITTNVKVENPASAERQLFQTEEIKSEFQAHQFWKVNNTHNIDDLMDEL